MEKRIVLLGILLIGVMLFVTSSTVYAADYIKWTNIPTNKNVDLNSIIFGNGKFVAVGENGVIQTSSDGYNWVEQKSPVKDDLTKVIFNGSVYIALGSNKIVKSEDGVAWRVCPVKWRQNSNGVSYDWDSHFYDVIWNGRIFVAVGRGVIAYSGDGTSWETADGIAPGIWHLMGGVNLGDELYSVAWNGSVFAGIGMYNQENYLYTSEDGVNWEKTQCPSLHFKSNGLIASNKNKFYIPGDLETESSNDGKLWTVEQIRGVTTQFYFIRHLGDRLIGAGDFIYSSVDGISWTAISKIEQPDIRDIAWNGREYFAVGKNASVLKLKPDGTWENINRNVVFDFSSAATNGKRVVAVGDEGQVITSDDGVTWTKRESGVAVKLRNVIWHDSLFIVVGDNGMVLTSQDGVTWKTSVTGVVNPLNKVIWGDGHYVAVGQHETIIVSYDGLTWKKVNGNDSTYLDENNDSLCDVAFNGKQYIAVSASSYFIYSDDGLNWKRKDCSIISDENGTNYFDRPSDIHWNGKAFIMATNLTAALSRDGLNWKMISPGSRIINKLFPVQNYYLASGEDGSVSISGDGLEWQNCGLDNNAFKINSILSFKNKLIAVGENGVVFNGILQRYPPAAKLTVCIHRDVSFGGPFVKILAPQPLMVSNNMMIPAQNLAGFINANYKYDKKTATLTMTRNGRSIKYIMESNYAYVNGKKTWIPVYPRLVKGIPFVNIKEASAVLGYIYRYDDLMKRIYLDIDDRTNKSNITWKNAAIKGVTGEVNYTGIAQGNNSYVIVSYQGKILYSTNGIEWAVVSDKQEYQLNAVKWNGKKYVAVGGDTKTGAAVVLISNDGKTWVTKDIKTLPMFIDISFKGNLLVAVGDRGTIATSTDGVKWTKRLGTGTGAFCSIAWSGTKFAAIDIINGYIYVSSDGIKWTKIKKKFDRLDQIFYYKGSFVAVNSRGTIYNSVDGINWYTVFMEEGKQFGVVIYNGKNYLLFGHLTYYQASQNPGILLSSPNAKIWYKVDAPDIYPDSGIWDGKKYILVGSKIIIGTPK